MEQMEKRRLGMIINDAFRALHTDAAPHQSNTRVLSNRAEMLK
jgi:hypothetical protein